MGTWTALQVGKGCIDFRPCHREGNLVFALEGFRNLRREGVRVGVGFTATVDVVLDLARRRKTSSLSASRLSLTNNRPQSRFVSMAVSSQTCRAPEACQAILAAAPAFT